MTDIFRSFYEVAKLMWERFECVGRPVGHPGLIPPHVGDVIESLEFDLFRPACARRVWNRTGKSLTPDQVSEAMQVCDLDGNPREGLAGRYQMNGFAWGTPSDESISPFVDTGELGGVDLETVRLFVRVVAPDPGSRTPPEPADS